MEPRKYKRMVAKVKKVRAFLDVARLNEDDNNTKLKVGQKRCLPGDFCTLCPKVAKTDNDNTSVIDFSDRSKLPIRFLTEEERAEIVERKKESMTRPKVFLTMQKLSEEYKKRLSKLPDTKEDEEELDTIPSLYPFDIQSLILHALLNRNSSYYPRWCKLLRGSSISSIVVMVIDGVSLSDVHKYTDSFSFLFEKLPMHVAVKSPYEHNSTIEEEIFKVRLSESQLAAKIRETKQALTYRQLKRVSDKADSIIEDKLSDMVPTDTRDKFDRRLLLLNLKDMIKDGYPLPVIRNGEFEHFTFSKAEYKEVTNSSPMFAVDCEMCNTEKGRELSRISVVNEKLEVLMDRLVKPPNVIIDYATRFSGITEDMLRNVTTRLEDVRKEFQKIIPADAILLGHSLCNDLEAMEMFHPYIIDTSVIYNLSNVGYKSGLSTLSRIFLKKHIQLSLRGHSPVEDAIATMELVLLKLRTGIAFGDVMSGCDVSCNNIASSMSSPGLTSTSQTLTDGKSIYINPTAEQIHQPLYDILHKSQRSYSIISKVDVIPSKLVESNNVVTCSDDAECIVKCKQELQNKRFVWVNLHDCVDNKKQLKSSCEAQKKYSELNNSIKEVFESCPTRSLFITVFSGKKKKKLTQDGGTYIGVT